MKMKENTKTHPCNMMTFASFVGVAWILISSAAAFRPRQPLVAQPGKHDVSRIRGGQPELCHMINKNGGGKNWHHQQCSSFNRRMRVRFVSSLASKPADAVESLSIPPALLSQSSSSSILSSISSSLSAVDELVAYTGVNYLAEHNITLQFPSYSTLMSLTQGQCITSEKFTVSAYNGRTAYDFCVKLYPRGGGHRPRDQIPIKSTTSTGLGNIIPWLRSHDELNERVAVYLQFLPPSSNNGGTSSESFNGMTSTTPSTVDATFAIRLIGNQREGPRFDVEWKSGMRFVDEKDSNLAEGRANDFGAHLMYTNNLSHLLGIRTSTDNNSVMGESDSMIIHHDHALQVRLEMTIHDQARNELSHAESTKALPPGNAFFTSVLRHLSLSDLRTDPDSNEKVRVGRIVVPVLKRLSQRPQMFQTGAYPGVEYRIMRIVNSDTEQELFYSRPGVAYELRPIYPLVPQLERRWPVRVQESDIPLLLTPVTYNVLSALGSMVAAITGLAAAFIISQAVSLFVIPSRSMEPTLQIGDVLLVEKVTPRFSRSVTGDVVLFHPPEKLQDIVARTSGGQRLSNRDLFVKRVAAEPGDVLSVEKSGLVHINGQIPSERRDICSAEPLGLIRKFIDINRDISVQTGQVAVLGDCSSVSIDSRVWGPLPTSDIVGRPIVRVWPLSRFGLLSSLAVDTD